MCDGWVFILVCFFTEDALNQTCSLSSLLLACTRIIPLSFLIQMTILFLFLLLYSNPASQLIGTLYDTGWLHVRRCSLSSVLVARLHA